MKKKRFVLYKCTLISRKESDYLPSIKGLECKIVSTSAQLKELIEIGYHFPFKQQIDHNHEDVVELSEEGTDFPLTSNQIENRLKNGAVAFFLFTNREMAATGWVVMTRQAQASLFYYPYKVNFSNREACIESSWTNPKFRKHGLHTYITYKRQAYLLENGIHLSRTMIQAGNTYSMKTQEKFYPQISIYAKGTYFRLFGLRIWKESLIKNTK
jgi:hypothetical protein